MRTFLLVFLLSVPATQAAENARPAALSLVRLITPRDRYQGMLEQLARPLIVAAQREQKDPQQIEAGAASIRAAAGKALPYEDLLDWTADVYAAHFSAAELRQLEKFYRTPLGAKLNNLLPQVTGEVFQKVVQVFPKRFEAALKEQR